MECRDALAVSVTGLGVEKCRGPKKPPSYKLPTYRVAQLVSLGPVADYHQFQKYISEAFTQSQSRVSVASRLSGFPAWLFRSLVHLFLLADFAIGSLSI
jgi:hypothetical protein